MPEVPTDEAVTDPIVASEEEPRDSEVDPESPPGMTSFLLFSFLCFSLPPLTDIFFCFLPADLPEDSDDFEPSMDATFDDASDELMEAESILPVVEEGTL